MNAALRAPLPRVARAHSERSDVLVISSDDALLIELGPLLGDRYRVHTVDAPDRIGEQVETARWIGIVDADSLAAAHAAISRLEAQYPRCPLILITARPDAWVGSVARDAVLRAIGRDQVATGRLGEALLAAEERLSLPAVDDEGAAEPDVRPGRLHLAPRRRGSFWAGAALLLVLGVNGAWLYHHYAVAIHGGGSTVLDASTAQHDSPQRDSSPPQVTPTVAAPRQQSVLELLSAARVAFRDQRLLPQPLDGASSGDSALELYGQVLRQDPQDDEARQGMKRLLVVGRERIAADLASGQFDDASGLLDLFRAAGMAPGELQPLERSISAAQPRWLAQRAAQRLSAGDFKAADGLIAQASARGADAATLQDLRSQEAVKKLDLQLRTMATQVDAAIQDGALLPPTSGNARARVAAMRSIARSHPLTLRAQEALQDALVQAGDQATRAAHFEVAERDLAAASELGGSTLLTLARSRLQAARSAASRSARVVPVSVPAIARTPVRALAPTASAPAPTPALMPTYIAARPTRALSVNYPDGVKEQDGSVVVEFTLSANGKASQARVVESDLPKNFDRQAISAVRDGRYSTRELVNRRPARARIKLRFTPGEG